MYNINMFKFFKYFSIRLCFLSNNEIQEPIFFNKEFEENIVNSHGTIILREVLDNNIIYICSKEGLTNIIYVSINGDYTINKIINNHKNFHKKKFPHTKIILSTGPRMLNKTYLKNKYASNINIEPIINLINKWDITIYKHIIKMLEKPFAHM